MVCSNDGRLGFNQTNVSPHWHKSEVNWPRAPQGIWFCPPGDCLPTCGVQSGSSSAPASLWWEAGLKAPMRPFVLFSACQFLI